MEKQLTYVETIKCISEIKKFFEHQLESRLSLTKVQGPLFVNANSGLQDELSGLEKPVSFKKGDEQFEIVHSLAKWKRYTLEKYKFPTYSGLYTDTKAIRKDEDVDQTHSLLVEQWDWEKVISEKDRTVDYLKSIVSIVYKSIRQTYIYMKQKYPFLDIGLPKSVTFITSQELEDIYPDKTPTEREQLIAKEKKAVFIIGIGDTLKSGISHDTRSTDYDDWKLNGDLFIYFKKLGRAVELSSMGIRVDKKSLKYQLEKSHSKKDEHIPYYEKIFDGKLPYTIGGGIGESRLCMLILGKTHIAEVQASSWEEKTYKQLSKLQIL